jgi:hypothetical protein
VISAREQQPGLFSSPVDSPCAGGLTGSAPEWIALLVVRVTCRFDLRGPLQGVWSRADTPSQLRFSVVELTARSSSSSAVDGRDVVGAPQRQARGPTESHWLAGRSMSPKPTPLLGLVMGGLLLKTPNLLLNVKFSTKPNSFTVVNRYILTSVWPCLLTLMALLCTPLG